MMDIDLVYHKKKALIGAQIVGVAVGLVFALFSGCETFWEILGAVILSPIIFAVLLRFCVRTYQFAKVKLGVKVQDSDGAYAVIEQPGRGIFAAVVAFFLPFCIAVPFAQVSETLFIIVIFALIIVGALFCLLDIRYMINYRREKKNHAHHEQK